MKNIFTAITLSLILFAIGCGDKAASGANAKDEKPEAKTVNKTQPLKETSPKPDWKPGVYRGLEMEKATVADLKRVLGEPEIKATGDKGTFYHYKITEPKSGKLAAWVDKRDNRIHSIELTFEDMTREETVKTYGPDFSITHYSRQDCPGDPFDATSRYEDPNGPDQYTEYRKRGVSILFSDDDAGRERVQHIFYSRIPPKGEKKGCK